MVWDLQATQGYLRFDDQWSICIGSIYEEITGHQIKRLRRANLLLDNF